MCSMRFINLKLCLLLSVVLFAGCNANPKTELTEDGKAVQTIVSKLDKDTQLKTYYILSGMCEYVQKYEGIETTTQAIKLFRTVRDRLKISSEGLVELDKVVEARLLKFEFDVPKKMSDKAKSKDPFTTESTNREEFVRAFREFSEGAKNAIIR